MYGATEFNYAQDPDFQPVSSNPKYWKKVIDAFYSKYQGFGKWHTKIVQEVTLTGKLVVPSTGRTFDFKRYPNRRGELAWPVTHIKNFPVQGTGADLMAVARCIVYKRWLEEGYKGKLVNTVHDSIVADVPDDEVKSVCRTLIESFKQVPEYFKAIFGVEYDLPFLGEIQVGHNLCDMEEVNLKELYV